LRIRNNKKHLVVNKEYSRLPYWTDDGYEDVQKSVSQKYVQDTYGAFAESENQLPYLSDADYQGLEYQYQNPEFFNPTDLPDVDFTGTAPKGTCYELWDSLFGHLTGAFIPTDSEWNSLREYNKKCPLIYMPHICCLGMKISGPTTLTPGEEAYYSVSGGASGCAYDMKASGGEFVGNKYFAPSTPGTYELYITPWMSDDQGKKCASMSVTVQSASCTGVIGYTTLQMATSATQTLTVTGGAVGDVYTWTTTSGSFDTDTGTSVVFTAPATNANCANNPTISLTCGGNVVDTVQIAVNGSGDTTNPAYRQAVGFSEFRCYYESSTCKWMCAFAASFYYNCAGTFLSVYSSGVGYSPSYNCGAGGGMGVGGACNAYPGVDCCSPTSTWCEARKAQYCTTCSTAAEAAELLGGADLRTAAMKTAGCCPAALL
jgi:hypothetical protein